MRKVSDDEIQTISVVCDELVKHSVPARRRILGYVCARLAEEDGGPPHIVFQRNGGEAANPPHHD